MAYEFYLDGILKDNPEGDRSLITTVKRFSSSLDGFLVTQDARLTFKGSAYDYLYNAFYAGLCGEATIEITETCDNVTYQLYKGIIKFSDMEISETGGDKECVITTPIQDNSYYARINNNRNIPITLTSQRTKNQVEVTPPQLYTVTAFVPATGVTGPVLMYRLYDVFEFLVAVMSDGEVGFASNFLQDPDYELFLSSGYALWSTMATGGALPPNPAIELTFEKLYQEISKKKNLSFEIEFDSYGDPVLRIENKDYFYQDTDALSFEDIKGKNGLKIQADKGRLYGSVKVGSEHTYNATYLQSFNDETSYYGYKLESFHPMGQCNLDNTLDLVSDYVISSNVIEATAVHMDEDWWDEIFLIECENINQIALTADAIAYEFFGQGTPPFIYNQGLNNFNVIKQYQSYLQSELVNFFGLGTDEFKARLGQDDYYTDNGQPGTTAIPITGLTVEPYIFPDETAPGMFDGSGNYNNVTGEYTVPADGNYTFAVTFDIGMAGFYPGIFAQFIPQIFLYDSGMVLKDSSQVIFQDGQNSVKQWIVTGSFAALTGDIVRVGFDLSLQGTFNQPVHQIFMIGHSSTFECNGTPEGGGAILGGSENNYKVIDYTFSYPLSPADFRTLLTEKKGVFTFSTKGVTRKGWLEECKYDHGKQMLTSIKLVSDNTINPVT